jgi:hypothetical protein
MEKRRIDVDVERGQKATFMQMRRKRKEDRKIDRVDEYGMTAHDVCYSICKKEKKPVRKKIKAQTKNPTSLLKQQL